MNLLTPYWLYIKIGLIVLLCGLCSLLTYNYQSNKYEKKLLEIKNAQYSAIAEATNKAIEKERVNQETTQSLESKYMEKDRALRAMAASFTELDGSYRRLRFQSSSCIQASPSSSPPASSPSASTNTSGGQCELSEIASRRIDEIALAADLLRNRADICKQYAEAITKQREEMMKEDK